MKFMEDKKVWPICLDFTESNYLIRNSVFAHSVGYNSWRNLLVLSVIAIWISKQTFSMQIHKQIGHTNQKYNDKRLCFFQRGIDKWRGRIIFHWIEYFYQMKICIWAHFLGTIPNTQDRIFFWIGTRTSFLNLWGAPEFSLLRIFQKSTIGIEHWIYPVWNTIIEPMTSVIRIHTHSIKTFTPSDLVVDQL